MPESPTVNRAQALSELEEALGCAFPIRACDELISYGITDTLITVTVRVITVVDTVRETRYTGAVLRMQAWTRGAADGRLAYQKFEVADDTFVPWTDHKLGKIETPVEYHDRRRWEGMQYRVGTESSPMDSAQRAAEGFSPMQQYWMKG